MSVVNVANLMVTFTRRRQHELAVRRAIGATWFRLLRQQLVLSGTLGVFGTVVGLAVAVAATRLLVVLMPPDVPRLARRARRWRRACLRVGDRLRQHSAVRQRRRDSRIRARRDALDLTSMTRATPRLAGAKLVAAEVAIGLALSVSAALMIRSLVNLRSVDLGFQTESTVAGRVSLPSAKYRVGRAAARVL